MGTINVPLKYQLHVELFTVSLTSGVQKKLSGPVPNKKVYGAMIVDGQFSDTTVQLVASSWAIDIDRSALITPTFSSAGTRICTVAVYYKL